MNKRQLKIASVEQRKNNVSHHLDTANNPDQRKSVSTELKIGKLTLFDILNKAFLGTYREVFNAWDPAESKVFTFLKTTYARLIGVRKNNTQTPLTLQLIPIDPKQEDVFAEVKRLQENGN